MPSHPIGIQKALKISAKYTNTQISNTTIICNLMINNNKYKDIDNILIINYYKKKNKKSVSH